MKLTFRGAGIIVICLWMGQVGCASSKVKSVDSMSSGSMDQIVSKFEEKAVDSVPAGTSASVPVPTPLPSPTPVVKETKAQARKRIAAEKKEAQKKLAAEKKLSAAAGSGVGASAPAAGGEKPKAESSTFKVPNRRPKVSPFWIGENQVLDVTYLGMVAGQFELELLPMKVVNARKVYHFEGRAKSSSLFNIVYSLNDKIESFMDYEGLFSYKFHMLLDQTRQKRDSLELYDYDKKQVYYWNRKNHVTKGYSEIKEYKPIELMSQDSFSAYHFLRTLPLETGKQYSIPVVSEGNSWEAVATVLRREVVSTPIGKIPAIVVRPQTRYQGVLKQGQGETFIWLSDDDRRFILQFEAKVKIGSVIGVIKKIVPGEKPPENE